MIPIFIINVLSGIGGGLWFAALDRWDLVLMGLV